MFNHVVHKRGHIVSAEPASAWSSVATKKNEGVERQREELTQVTPSLQGSRATGGTNIWTETPETGPETEPPQEKRARRESAEKELEEGELVDSSEEDKEDEEAKAEENTPCDNGCGDAKGHANDSEVMEDELGAGVDDNVNGGINKDGDSGRDQCVNEDITGPADDNSAATASAEVSVTKEDAL